MQSDTKAPENKETSKKRQRSGKYIYPILGIFAGWLLCGVPLLFLIFSGLLDPIISKLPKLDPLSTPIPPVSQNYTDTPTAFLTQFPTPTLTPIIARAEMRLALELVAQGEYAQAIQHLDQIIAAEPNADYAYYARAKSYVELSRNQRSFGEFLSYTENALIDMDRAIAIQPTYGDYFALRHEIMSRLASEQDYTVDRVYLYQIAYENLQTAYALGTTLDYPERQLILDLIFLDRCDEALTQVKGYINQTSENDSSLGGLFWIQSEAQACLGQVEEALKTIDRSMFNNENMEHKLWLKAVYLYEAGRFQESLAILDDLINQKPGYYGYRYYLRSLVYYQLGETDLATEDFSIGAGSTWEHTGLYSLVLGELALADGNTEDAIYNFQTAEASLSNMLNPLRWHAQNALKELGTDPLSLTSSVNLIATPISPVESRPTARPLPTESSNSLNISYPYNVKHAIHVDLSTGLGAFTLPPEDQYLLSAYGWPLFHFQPVEPIQFKDVKSFVIHLIPAENETGNPPSQIQLWVPGENRVQQLFSPEWGDNAIEQPSIYPLPDGDIYFYVVNGPSEVRLKNLSITLVVETQDGNIQTYGAE